MGAGITILQSGGGYAPIEVANYAALPPVGTSPGTTYAVLASQGTSWLPGSLGGTYYPAGFYYDATTEYLYTKTPYQANQTEVDAGINDDKFVTPKTFIQGLTNWFTNSKLLSVLGFTPVPNSRTINGYDLTSNRVLTATDVDALKRDGSNANSDVDLGTYALNAKSVKVNGTGGAGHYSMKHQSAGISASASESALGADSSGNPIWKNDGNAQVNLQISPIVVNSNITAENDRIYHVVANATFTDPTGVEGRGYVVFIRNGTAIIGGNSFAVVGTLLMRVFSSGVWTTLYYYDYITSNSLFQSRANLSTNVSADQASNSKYSSVKAVFDWAVGLFVPQTRSINGLDLSVNRTLTTANINDSTDKRYVTDAQLTVINNTSGTNSGDETATTIRTKLGITTLSGSNTGDETQASIISKLGYTPQAQFLSKLVFKEQYGGAVTGTTSETLIKTFTFSANELPTDTTLYVETLGYRTGTPTANGTFRLKINTSNTLTGATQIAVWGMGGNTNVHSQNRRRFLITGGNIIGIASGSSLNTDLTTTTTAESINALDVTNTFYLFVSYTPSNSGDTLNHGFTILKNF